MIAYMQNIPLHFRNIVSKEDLTQTGSGTLGYRIA